MKKIILTLLGVVLLAPSLKGQTTKEYILNFEDGDFDYLQSDNQLYIMSKSSDYLLSNDTSEPAIPYKYVDILLRPDEKYLSFQSQLYRKLLYQNVSVSMNPEVCKTNERLSTNHHSLHTGYAKNFPDRNVEYVCEDSINGYHYIRFKVYPFAYNGREGELYMITKITLSVSTSMCNRAVTHNNFVDPITRENIKSRMINGDCVDMYYGVQGRSVNNNGYDYLIITRNNLKSAFQKLADWKTIKGVRTRVSTVEEILNGYSCTTLTDTLIRLQNYILYFNWRDIFDSSYVLLGGDYQRVPTLCCPVGAKNFRDVTPVDAFYSSFVDWDVNLDGILGDSLDNFYFEPTHSVSRLPVKNTQEASNYVNRLITYEKNPTTLGWNDEFLLIGCQSSDTIIYYDYNPDGSGKSDGQYNCENLFDSYVAPYWNGNRRGLYDTYSDFPGLTLNSYNLGSVLTNNYRFVYDDTHGNETGWYLSGIGNYPADFYTSEMAFNSRAPINSIIMTSACNTSAFDYTARCLGASFVCNTNGGGALAYLGSSRAGFFYRSLPFGPSFRFFSNILKSIFKDRMTHYGDIVKKVKSNMAGSFSNSQVFGTNCDNAFYWWLTLSTNPFGDAEMPIYASRPLALDSVDIRFINDSLVVNCGMDSCSVTITSFDDSGASYYNKIVNTRNVSIPNMTEGYNVCVTKDNYIPYLETVHNNLYIQNKTINRRTDYSAEHVIIGRDVTSATTEGPVTIRPSGRVTINARDVYIKNSFEVKTGGTLSIETTN